MAESCDRLEREILGAGGARLFIRRWSRAGPAETGLIAVVPGLADHGDRYPYLVEAALEAGFGIAAIDLRGCGRSGLAGRRVPSFDEYVLDVDRFLSELRRESPRERIFAWGHSTGALVLLAYLSLGFGRGIKLCAAVASSPPFRATCQRRHPWRAAGEILARLAFVLGISRAGDPGFPSRGPGARRVPAEDRLFPDPMAAGLRAQLCRAAHRLFASPKEYGIPTLFAHGGSDTVADPRGTRSYYERSPLLRKAFRLYDGASHELHNDPARIGLFRDAFAFFEAGPDRIDRTARQPATGEPQGR